MRSSRVLQALTCGLAVLLAAGCTGDPEPPVASPEEEPLPVPTSFEGEAPPGIEGEVLRYLHGDTADVHDILDDPLGVRISPVGEAFLISSGGEDHHLLHDAATGETLWEGEARFSGFDVDRDGDRVLLMADADGAAFVLDARGEILWEPESEGDTYLDGVAVRRPDGWSTEEPHGEFALLDTDGDELWAYGFDAPPEEDPEGEEPDGGDSDGSGEGTGDADGGPGLGSAEAAEDEEAPELGVPVASRDDLVLLASGGSALHARSVAPDTAGEELWTVDGGDGELGLPTSVPVPSPQVLGFYGLPDPDGYGGNAEDSGDDEDSADSADDEDSADSEGEGDDGTEEVVLLRWSQPEASSTLSAHDPETGDLRWALEEPGPNPVTGPFDQAGVAGSLYDDTTGTLLLPQASGEATAVAVDLAAGEVLWGLEDDDGSISPAFAFNGLFYGSSRASDGSDEQLVLDAVTMDVVDDELPTYVEAVTGSGHAVLVHDRQRFVYGPPPEEPEEDAESAEPTEPEAGESADPPSPSGSPDDEAS